jgi:O-antigen/teichoic acid export membrane protein
MIKNFLFLGFGEILARFFSFLAIIYISHKINLGNFGMINFALGYINYFSLLTNWGLLIYGTRKIAEGIKIKETVDQIFSVRFLLGIFSTLLAVLIINIIKEEFFLKKLILIYSFFIFFDALSLEWFFLGKEKVSYCLVSRLLSNFLYFLLLILFLKSDKEIFSVPFAFVFGVLVGNLFLFLSYQKKYSAQINWRLNFKENLFLLKTTLPLGGVQILIQIYTLFNIIFLGFLKWKKELGYYSAGYRLLLVLMIFDRIFNQITLPFLTRKFKEGNFAILKNITRLILVFILPVSFFLYLISDKLFLWLFPPEYFNGVLIFQTLLFFWIFTILNSIFSLGLLALGKDKEYFRNVLIGTLINFFLAIFLIKNFRHSGAAWALVITEFLIFLLNFKRFQNYYPVNFLNSLPLPLLLTALTFFPIFLLRKYSFWCLSFLFLIIYLFLFMIFRKKIKEDYQLLK